MSTFVKGLAWTVALFAGIATIFALFGGQQWLEQRGWTLAPSPAQSTNAAEPTATPSETEGTQQETPEPGDTAQVPSGRGHDSSWEAVFAWSEHTFDNLLWGIVAIGFSMLVSGAAGALTLHASAPISGAAAFLQGPAALICIAVVVIVGLLLYAADPGYLVWFITLTAVSALLGFFLPVYPHGH